MALRPIYGPDEEVGTERLARGVSGAIEYLLSEQEKRRVRKDEDRQEVNRFTEQGFTPVPRGEERLAPAPRMNVTRPGGATTLGGKASIGNAIGFTLDQGQPGQGYDSVQARGGQTFRRPGVQMREQQSSDRRVKEKLATEGPPLTVQDRKDIARSRPSSGMSQSQRLELEGLRQQGRMAIQSMISGRGNTATQLQAAKAVQSSLDSKVRALQTELASARRAYDDDRVHALLEDLEAARSAADEYRDNLASVSERSGTPPARRSAAHAPDPRDASARRGGARTAPRTDQVRPPVPRAPGPAPAKRQVPPPVRP